MRVLQVTPETDPLGGGVRATARAVARVLEAAHGVESTFTSGAELRGRGALPERPSFTHVVLHYVSYGYAARGCPWWLVRAVETWRRAAAAGRLVTVFHEVHASGPPWTSAFWLAPVQRSLARRLAAASDALWTSLDLYRALLEPWARGSVIVTAPVPSAVGEPATIAPYGEREPQMVVFGTPGLRQRAYGLHADALAATCGRLGIDRIVDVGAPAAGVPRAVGAVPVEARGRLPDPDVSRLLAHARAGFLAYPPDFLEKSSVFAAYAAHGTVPVCAWHEPRSGPLEAHRHFLPAGGSAGEPAAVAVTANAWYREHGVASQAACLARLLEA